MKTVNIKGKQYVEVKERVKFFHEKYPKGSITTELLTYKDKTWVVKATIVTSIEEPRVFTGMAQEVESDNYKEVNFTSALENAETSAVGRAMAFLNIGVVDGIASSDEINKAKNRSSTKKAKYTNKSVYDPAKHIKVKMGFVEDFKGEIAKFEAKGGGYDSKAKIWFVPKDIKKKGVEPLPEPFTEKKEWDEDLPL